MLDGVVSKLKGLVAGKSLTKKIGGIKKGSDSASPFDASPGAGGFGDDMGGMDGFGGEMGEMGDPGGFGDDMGDMGGFGGDMGGFGDGGDPGMGAPSGGGGEPVESELAKENAEKIDELSSKLAKIDVKSSALQRATDEMRETVNKLDESVLELLSLYEIVSNQVNPFVGEGEGDSATLERFDKVEKRINSLGESVVVMQNDFEAVSQQEAVGISDDTNAQLEGINTRFDEFAETIETIRSENEQFISEELEQIITEKIEELMHDIPVNVVSGDGAGTPNPADDLVSVGVVENEVLKSTFGTSAALQHLDHNPMTAVILLNWIEFLMERVGRNNLMDALDYYVDIEWIGEPVRDEMLAYARGIDYYVEKPTWRLLPEDHTKSLIFIERLRGHRIDRNMLSTIEREMSKVKHGLEELYGI
ncbi:MAG: flagella protein [Methanosarcinales archaeon]|nr:MAG: flagella protein [Methanosarcinales archaeon]